MFVKLKHLRSGADKWINIPPEIEVTMAEKLCNRDMQMAKDKEIERIELVVRHVRNY